MKTLNCKKKVLATVLALALFPLAATAEDMAAANENSVADVVGQAADAGNMEVVTVMGVVNKDQDKLMLNADNESYLLDTQVDEALIGQKVVATGIVVTENGAKMFKPQSIKVAQ